MTSSPVRIIGAAQTDFGKFRDRSLESIAIEAGIAAVRDAGVDRTDLQALFCGNAYAGSLVGQRISKEMGLDGLPVFNHENACASGASALAHACLAVGAGQFTTVLVLGVEQLSALGGGLLPIGEDDPEIAAGLTMPAAYAMRTESYLSRFGGKPEDIAQVAVKSRRQAGGNPRAQYRTPVTVDEVMESRLIADPITLLQMCPNADGAAALVVTSDPAAGGDDRSVQVLSSVVASGQFFQGWRDMAWPDITLRAVEEAYDQAGVTAADVDVVEVHDAAAIGEIMYYEALGLCERGEGMSFVFSQESSLAGRTAVNTGGGLLSRGHPLGATGVVQVVELVAQLRGETGANQVSGAEVALAHCTGGGIWGVDNGACAVHVLGR
ncbi:thiolase family protein [Aeromicrobium sp. YIM 150415]|uniref:thiolase family protein n=1 Tax=Aeromicrobium sp. YIM 150415 TaxID=2803912 RepID=UPI001963C6EC|nr:thiolase family protein [Aeromicrobium sp. YIM 150415]MBM9463462.1 thiolase family protein [Aeromicrobium sp. YIM 150415]